MPKSTPIERLLLERGESVRRAWLDRALAVYAEEYKKFLAGTGDAFANPVGAALREGIAALLEAIAAGADPERCRAALDPIVRIRAVQELPPSKALAFVPLLKEVARETVREDDRDGETRRAMAAFDAAVDQVTLLAFDVYCECRERIHKTRANELRRNTALLSRRPRPRSEPEGGNRP